MRVKRCLRFQKATRRIRNEAPEQAKEIQPSESSEGCGRKNLQAFTLEILQKSLPRLRRQEPRAQKDLRIATQAQIDPADRHHAIGQTQNLENRKLHQTFGRLEIILAVLRLYIRVRRFFLLRYSQEPAHSLSQMAHPCATAPPVERQAGRSQLNRNSDTAEVE